MTAVRVVEMPQEPGGSFREVVEQHSQEIFRLAYRLTGNEHDAEEVVQEAFLKAYRNLHRFDRRARMGTWLYRIATNCAMDLLRSRKRRSRELSVEPTGVPLQRARSRRPGPDQAIMDDRIQNEVRKAMEMLSDLERAAFVLRHFHDTSIKQISETLELSESATKHAVFRAVRKLRKALTELR